MKELEYILTEMIWTTPTKREETIFTNLINIQLESQEDKGKNQTFFKSNNALNIFQFDYKSKILK